MHPDIADFFIENFTQEKDLILDPFMGSGTTALSCLKYNRNFWGIEQEKIGHTMSSVLIGKNREVLGVWKGENWEVSEVSNAIKLLTK